MIVYFTGTGNSRYCAQMLAAELGDELRDAFYFIKDGIGADFVSTRPWVFVAPTYAWQLPHIFTEFIRGGSFAGCRDAYFVMTCGDGIGDPGAKLAPLCEEKGFEYRGVLQVVMPENYVAMFPVPDAAKSAEIVAAAGPALKTGMECIRREEPFPAVKTNLVDRLKTSLVNPLFYRLFVKAKAFFSTDACVGCGKCVEACPLNNVSLKGGRPIWGASCTHCMACICGCPQEAIEYGKRSQGKPRYQCKSF